ncbi:MAG: DUF1294 domain-containing protein [Lachnospiraceae bacterium]|nr:DUF1294 domain-containing protein [Lachnospiraceae bacterium]
MPPVWIAVIAWLVIINLVAFAIFGIDKKRAKKGQWRIPEKTLFLSAILGGSIGAILGMYLFRHKTKHWYFRIGIPAILIAQIVIVYLLVNKGIITLPF